MHHQHRNFGIVIGEGVGRDVEEEGNREEEEKNRKEEEIKEKENVE